MGSPTDEETGKQDAKEEASPEKQGTKRSYTDIAVNTPNPAKLCYVIDERQRFTHWERMRLTMLKAIGRITEEEEESGKMPACFSADPQVQRGETCYIVATTTHPTKPDTEVCLIEKGLDKGFVLMPATALKEAPGKRVQIIKFEQQYSVWKVMEELLKITITPGFKAKKDTYGYLIATTPHPKDKDLEVCAVLIPPQTKDDDAEGKTILIRRSALREIPSEIVEIVTPDQRLTGWGKMAEELGITEAEANLRLYKGAHGVLIREREHLKKPGVMVCGVEIFKNDPPFSKPGGGGRGRGNPGKTESDPKQVMMMKSALRFIKS